ncbi:MAG TPA: PilN domain-containing protein [Longimicrobiaceae bacterium]|nr:PilN domain-containing protein [Longimicrobiaceae bacterium]
MSDRLGVAVGSGEIRAAYVERRGGRIRVRRALRVPCPGLGTLDEALREVHERLVPGRSTPAGVAPPPGEVWLKLLALPPLPAADRARMVEMDADRFFPVRGEPVLVDVPAEGPVAAARAAEIEALVTRVEESLGPVRAVEPAPRAAARGWAALDPSLRRRSFAVLARQGAWWDLAVARGGTLLGHARFLSPEPRALAEALAAAVESGAARPRVLLALDPDDDSAEVAGITVAIEERLPGTVVERRTEIVPGVPASFAPAVGLAVGPEGGLLPAPHRERLRRSARRRTAGWAAAAVLAAGVFFAIGPLGRSRSAAELEAEAARLAPRADTASRLLEEAHRARSRVAFTDSLARARPDWVGILAELTRRLPQGAYLTQLRAQAESRTIEVRGYAGSASAIVPILERSPRFDSVASIEATTRRLVGAVELENFAVRLKVVR